MKKILWGVMLSAVFLSPVSLGCDDYVIQKPTPFMGNHGEVFVVDDGSVWEVQYSYEYLYEYYPSVLICENRGLMIIGDAKIDVVRVGGGSKSGSRSQTTTSSDYIESRVNGQWEGWQGDTIVRLMNGQIWQQAGLELSLSLKLNPDVTVFQRSGRFYMLVDGEDKPVWVTRLN